LRVHGWTCPGHLHQSHGQSAVLSS
jgi:hypothetical protein